MMAVSGLGLDAQIPETLVYKVVANLHLQGRADVCGHPAVTVGRVFAMHVPDYPDHGLTVDVSVRRIPLQPLVVAGATDAHHLTDVFDVKLSRQHARYFELFVFKRTYYVFPSALFTTA